MRFPCQRNQQCAFGPRAKYKRMELAPRLCPYLAAPRSHRHSTEPVPATDLAAGKSRISPSELQERLKGQGTDCELSPKHRGQRWDLLLNTYVECCAPPAGGEKVTPKPCSGSTAGCSVAYFVTLFFFFFLRKQIFLKDWQLNSI